MIGKKVEMTSYPCHFEREREISLFVAGEISPLRSR